MRFEDPLPTDLMDALDSIRDRAGGLTERGEDLVRLFTPPAAAATQSPLPDPPSLLQTVPSLPSLASSEDDF